MYRPKYVLRGTIASLLSWFYNLPTSAHALYGARTQLGPIHIRHHVKPVCDYFPRPGGFMRSRRRDPDHVQEYRLTRTVRRKSIMRLANLVIVTLLASSAPTLAQTAPPSPPPEARNNAMAYVKAVTTGDLYEINSSQIALQRSQDADVRQFASRLIDDHKKTLAKTMEAAAKSGLKPSPPLLDDGFTASINELQTASAADFDRLYLGQQIPAHRAAFGLSSYYANAGDDPTLRRSAKKRSNPINRHLSAANKLSKRILGK